MTHTQFYALQYRPGEPGCPHYLSGEVSPAEWEWPMYVANPLDITVCHDYVYRLSEPNATVDFDFYGNQTNFVSQQFLSICDEMQVRYRAIPLHITDSATEIANKKYFVFLPAESVAFLDRDRSEYLEEQDAATGSVAMNDMFPETPVYAWVTRFVPRQNDGANLFRCTELMELVCTERFRVAIEQKALKGIAFVPLDHTYRYDPWGEAP